MKVQDRSPAVGPAFDETLLGEAQQLVGLVDAEHRVGDRTAALGRHASCAERSGG